MKSFFLVFFFVMSANAHCVSKVRGL